MLSAKNMANKTPKRAPRFTLIYSRAPRFCPVKVVRASAKLVTGISANPWILMKAPLPAIAVAPNRLTLDCTNTLAREVTEFWIPEGMPILRILEIRCL